MRNSQENSQNGFNLIELMIAMSVIGLLIGISVYSWQTITMRGNEAAAVGHIKKISTAQSLYASKNRGRFAESLDVLVDLNLVSREFGGASTDGYVFTVETGDSPSLGYRLFAEPVKKGGLGATGETSFYFDSDSDAITFTEENRRAGKDDPIL